MSDKTCLTVLYLCDGKACPHSKGCGTECLHTSNARHAKSFGMRFDGAERALVEKVPNQNQTYMSKLTSAVALTTVFGIGLIIAACIFRLIRWIIWL